MPLPFLLRRSWESRAGLFPRARRGHCFMSLRPEIVQSIAGAQWGYERFRITLPEMGAVP